MGTLLQEGDNLPPGWFFTGSSSCPESGYPDVAWGDGNHCSNAMGPWEFCFTIKVRQDPDYLNPTHTDLSLSFFTFSDGEIGCWQAGLSICELDLPEQWISEFYVTNNCLVVTSQDSIYPGTLDYAFSCAENGDTVVLSGLMENDTILLSEPIFVLDSISILAATGITTWIISPGEETAITVEKTGTLTLDNVQLISGSQNGVLNYGRLNLYHTVILENPSGSMGELILNYGSIKIFEETIVKN